jgi:hypothetical protein
VSAEALTILAGGVPSDVQVAALTAALTCLVEAEGVVTPDPTPRAYRSRWRRAGLLELSEVPVHVKDDGPPWRSA